jgi:hypothetical protein
VEVENGEVKKRGPAARCGRRAQVRVRSGGRGGGAEGRGGEGRGRALRRDRTVVEEDERRRRERAAASMAASPEVRGLTANQESRGFGNFRVVGFKVSVGKEFFYGFTV